MRHQSPGPPSSFSAEPARFHAGRDASRGAILAGVVVYRPDPAQLRRLVDALQRQADHLLLFLNSALPPDLHETLAAAPGVTLLEARSNLGIGAALNMLGLEACLRDAAAIVFFDQDSSPPSDLIARLAGAWDDLERAGQPPAVVGPRLVAAPGAASKAPTYRYHDTAGISAARRVLFAPTSGSLVPTAVLRRTGFFRADFFIDGIDVEWCFRAAALGLGSWVLTDGAMPHSVGSGVIGSRRLGWRMPNQRPFRMYCVVRNTLYGLRLGHIPLGWKLRQVAYLPLQMGAFALHHRLRWAAVKPLLLGLRDGLAGRLGPPPSLPD